MDAGVIILIAPSFNELTTISLIANLRQEGIHTTLVGLTTGAIPGAHGVVVKPEKALSGWEHWKVNHQVVVLSGDEPCGIALLSDPRVHLFINEVTAAGGIIAMTGQVLQIMLELGVMLAETAVCLLPPPNSPTFPPATIIKQRLQPKL